MASKRTRVDEIESFSISSLKKLKDNFNSNDTNKIIQNSLCANHLYAVSEDREYMQSRDSKFSHTIEPKLEVTNQGLSGRCWMFAVLNVLRYEIIRDLQLPTDFEFSESYLAFYEKIEKCNNFLTKFMTKESIDEHDLITRDTLISGLSEGGYWSSCANLIKKYGLVPKTCYLESINSFYADTLDNLMSTKLREFAFELVKTDLDKRLISKDRMMEEIYNILAKMLGTPPCPTDEFEWSFTLRQDLTDLLKKEQDRIESGKFETLSIKKTIKITPLKFYDTFINNKLDDYCHFSNDPRNTYNKYYESFEKDMVIGGDKTGYYNLNMDDITELCITSILNNTPIQFACDVNHYFHPTEDLFDTNCFNYKIMFKTDFNKLSKCEMLKLCESYSNHAMVIVGVDLDELGNPLKWKIENSWGRTHETVVDDDGYYIMSHEWFKRFVYDIVINKSFIKRQLIVKYNTAKKNKIILPEYDIMA